MARIGNRIKQFAVDGAAKALPNCFLRFHVGAPNATFGQAPAGTMLAQTAYLPDPSHGPASAAGVAQLLAPIIDDNVNVTGAAGSFVLIYDDGTTQTIIYDGTVTATGGNGDIKLSNINLVVGQELRITDFPITF